MLKFKIDYCSNKFNLSSHDKQSFYHQIANSVNQIKFDKKVMLNQSKDISKYLVNSNCLAISVIVDYSILYGFYDDLFFAKNLFSTDTNFTINGKNVYIKQNNNYIVATPSVWLTYLKFLKKTLQQHFMVNKCSRLA